MLCGVLYVLKKYDEKNTYLNYMYDTKTKTYKQLQVDINVLISYLAYYF